MITYAGLRKVKSKEKESKSLQKLSADFFVSVKQFLDEKEKFLEKVADKKDNLFSRQTREKVKREIANIKAMIRDIVSKREQKILTKAMLDSRVESKDYKNMLEPERELYDKVYEVLLGFRQKVMNGDKRVVFLDDVPKFVWQDSEFGPFKKGERALLPLKVAKILINSKKAKEE